MQQSFGWQPLNPIKSPGQAFRLHVVALSAIACAFSAGFVQAQSSGLGAYSGTIKVSGTEVGPEVSYSASIKISLPVTNRDGSSINAEFFGGEAPNATVSISQWDSSYTETSADSDGKFSSWKCKLAAPVEISTTPTGVLNVDLEAKTHALSITLLSTEDVAFDCENSRSGSYQKKEGVILYIGTGSPGMQFENPLPFTDAAHLIANYTLMPTPETKGKYGPIIQEWNLQLTD